MLNNTSLHITYLHMSHPSETIGEPIVQASNTPGTFIDGSYDRYLSIHSNDTVLSQSMVLDTLHSELQAFRTSPRSRFLLRAITGNPLSNNALTSVLQQGETSDLIQHQAEGGYQTVIGINNQQRSVAGGIQTSIRQRTQQQLQQWNSNVHNQREFEQQASDGYHNVREQGYHFDTTATAEELHALWSATFGWTREQCEALLNGESEEQLFTLKDEQGATVSACLVSEGESTEWATLPEHQRRGLIAPLITYANCSLIAANRANVFAELRWDRSLSPGLKAGFQPATTTADIPLLTNHVTVGNPNQQDVPDDWNQQRTPLSDGTHGAYLRTFIPATVARELFSDELLDTYLQHHAR